MRYVWSLILPGLGSACITVFEDNKGARHLAHSPLCASNSKHIDIRHHFLRELAFRIEFDIVAVESAATRRLPEQGTRRSRLSFSPGFCDEHLIWGER